MYQSKSLVRRKKVLFICGSKNQTTQMHAVGASLRDADCWFTPYYVTGYGELMRRVGLAEITIAGSKHAQKCFDYLRENYLHIDYRGMSVGNTYDLIVTCTDQIVPANVWGKPTVLCQEGILDPPNIMMALARRFPKMPMWLAGTAATGQSRCYQRFCVGSEGYKDHFAGLGLDRDKMIVTGIANFDNCKKYYDNEFPYNGFVLACTSDARETFKSDDREGFIKNVVRIAKGRRIIFKLHPNEKFLRAKSEIDRWAPGSLIYTDGSAEEMVANCDVLVSQWSTLVFVGMALGKECHSYHDMDEVKRLLPVQNNNAASNIANVCREVLAESRVTEAATELAARELAARTGDVELTGDVAPGE